MTESKLMTLQDNIIHLINNEDGQYNTLPQLAFLKEKSLEILSQKGLPTVKNEEYKYTHLQSITKESFQFPHISHTDNAGLVLQASDALNVHLNAIHTDLKGENKGVYRIVFFNGQFVKELSSFPDADAAVISTSYEAPNTSIGQLSQVTEDAFAIINNALSTDSISIVVKKNQSVDKPIHIIHLSQSDVNLWINPRLHIHAEIGSHVEIIESYDHQGSGIMMNNAVTEVVVDANAHIYHYDIQKNSKEARSIKNTFSTLATDARYSNYNFNLPGVAFSRNNMDIRVNGSNVNNELFGLVIANENQIVDNHTAVHHTVPHTESHQLYKGIVMDNSNLIFNGKIYVYEDAQKTNAFQQSNNLTLSPNATINAKPQLEIFADDVKCSHGSTIGQLDKNALFYLKSRGIGDESARKMMIAAFAYDVTEKVENETIKHYIEKQIASVLS